MRDPILAPIRGGGGVYGFLRAETTTMTMRSKNAEQLAL